METPVKAQKLFCLLLAFLCFAQSGKAQSFWTGADEGAANHNSTNWSDALNWSPNGAPTATESVFFNGVNAQSASALSTPGGGAGALNFQYINNIVDANFTISSLTYTNIGGLYQNTFITNGATLTITGTNTSGAILAIGNNSTDFGASAQEYATISGSNGTLDINNTNDNVFVGMITAGAGTEQGTLDMSGLGSFNASVNLFAVGAIASTSFGTIGTTYLARTNVITAVGGSDNEGGSDESLSLMVGETGKNGAGICYLYLGQQNTINANLIGVSLAKEPAEMEFSTNWANPSATIRAADGTSPVSVWSIGDALAQTGGSTSPTGMVDFTRGTVNALVNTMYIGRSPNASGPHAAVGTLLFNAGTIAAGTIYDGYQAYSNSDNGAGTIGVSGTGLLQVGTLILGPTTGGTGATNTEGILNVVGGSVEAGTINTDTNGMGISAIDLTNATLVLTNTMGSVTDPVSSLSVAGGATLNFNVANAFANASANAAVSNLYGDNSGAIIISALPNPRGYPAQFPLISYLAQPNGNVSFATLTLPPLFQGYISNDLVSTIWLVVTNGPVVSSVTWSGGVNNNWDTSTPNWNLNSSSVDYTNFDLVTFDDTAHTQNVNVTGAFTPIAWTNNNNNLNYTFSGPGSISGSCDLVLNGTKSVTLQETGGDNFGGGIQANAGTLVLDDANCAISGGLNIVSGATVQIGNNDSNGALPSGVVSDSGTLIFYRTNSTVVSTAISGPGGLTQEGGGTLTLSISNSYSGNTVVTAGTLALTGSGNIQASSGVTVNGAAFNVSAVSGLTTLNALTLSGATLDLTAGYLETNVTVLNSLSMSGAASTINVLSLPPIASYPATVVLISAGSISGYNLSLGTLPTATPSYSGSLSQVGNTVVLTLNSGPVGVRPYVRWSGVDALNNVSMNWSDAINWLSPATPIAGDYVEFGDSAAVGGTPFPAVGNGLGGIQNPQYINNIVNTNFTIGELNYSNVLSDYQNTFISNGVTLNVTSTVTSPRLFTVGSGSTDFGSVVENVTIGGTNGTVNFANTNGTLFVGLGDQDGAQAVLDTSGLGTLNASVSTILIGVGGTAGAVGENYESGIVYLARTNNITASLAVSGTETSDTSAAAVSLDIGDAEANAGEASYLYLGQSNAINADAIGVGRQKSTATMEFNPNFAANHITPSVYFRGASAASVTTWSVGDGVVNTGNAYCNGTCDFTSASGGSDGYINALIGTMYIGRSPNSDNTAQPAQGVFSFDQGIVSAATIYDGFEAFSNSAYAVGTITVNGTATLEVNTINLAATSGGTGNSATFGYLNITNGTVLAGTIAADPNAQGVSTLSLVDGTLVISNTIGGPGAPVTSLTISGGTLQLNPQGGGTNIIAGSVSIGGGTSNTLVNIASIANPPAGTFNVGLISYTGSSPGVGSLTLGSIPNKFSNASINDNGQGLIYLTITGPTLLTWEGQKANSTSDGNWSATDTNWFVNGTYTNYSDGVDVLFNDSAPGTTTVNLSQELQPTSVTISNSVLTYTLEGNGFIAGTASLTKEGTQPLILDNSSANAYTGGTTISAGALQVGNNDANDSLVGNVTDNGSLVLDRTSSNTVAGLISGTGSLTQESSGTNVLIAANSFNGGINISSGTVVAAVTGALGSNGATNTISFAGGTLAYGAGIVAGVTNTTDYSPRFSTNANQLYKIFVPTQPAFPNTYSSVQVTFATALKSTNGSLTKSGGGELILSGTNTVNGGITLSGGEIRANNTNGFGTNSIIETAAGTQIYFNNGSWTYPNNLTIIGFGSLEADNATALGAIRAAANGVVLSGTITLAGNAGISPRSSSPCTISGQITDGNNAYQIEFGRTSTSISAGSGTLVVSNTANNWHGDTIVADGTLQLGASGVIPNGNGFGNLIMSNAGTSFESGIAHSVFDLHGFNQTINGLSNFVGTAAATMNLLWVTNSSTTTPATLTVGNNNANGYFGGIVGSKGAGTLSLTKIGTGTETLTNINTYNGNTTINGGTLALSGPGSIANSPGIVIAGGAAFNVSGLTAPFALGSSQTLSNSASGAIINGSAGTGSGALSLTYSSGTPSLISTNGTLTLSAGTRVNINNTGPALGAGTYTIISAAALGSAGSVAGTAPTSVTVNGNGLVAGASASLQINGSPGTLNLVVTVSSGRPIITGINVSGQTLTLMATNGMDNEPFTLLEATNLASPIWIPIWTNQFNGSGDVSLSTNILNPAIPHEFFKIQEP